MPPGGIRKSKVVGRIDVRINGPWIEVIEQVRNADAERNAFAITEWNGNFLLQAGVDCHKRGHRAAVVSADNVIQIVHGRKGKSRSCIDGKGAIEV